MHIYMYIYISGEPELADNSRTHPMETPAAHTTVSLPGP